MGVHGPISEKDVGGLGHHDFADPARRGESHCDSVFLVSKIFSADDPLFD